ARRQLAGAPTRPEQARATHGLVAAYAGAAAALARATPTPFTRPSHFALLGALREAQRAYGAIEAAARAGDNPAYAAASGRVDAAEKHLDASITRLERLRLP